VSREVWIALVEVAPHEGNDIFDGGPGAFTNVLAAADGLSDYRSRVETALDREGLTVLDIEDAGPLHERLSRFEVVEELLELVPQAESGVVWDVFHVYMNHPAYLSGPVDRDGLPIEMVIHDDEGDWHFLHRGAVDARDVVGTREERVFERHPDLRVLVDLPEGWAAQRDSPTGTWRRFPLKGTR
jgi:hypothetical protein